MYKTLKRKFGISAQRVAVRAHVPWYWKWLLLVVLATLVSVLAWWMYDAGRKFAGFDRSQADTELSRQSELNAKLQKESA